MKFWDSSGLIPILLDQPESAGVRALLEKDREMVVWWGTAVECVSAAARLPREARSIWVGAPEGEEFVTFDERLALSGRLEGFQVISS